jgi:hypothetical protein
MNVVAVFDSRGQTWSWRVVDDAGHAVSSSGTEYPSMAEALKAGAEHRDRLAARRPPIVRQPAQARRPRPRP